MGIPRVMFLNTPFEFVQAGDPILRTRARISFDPGDPDPTWYGGAIGHRESDDIFIVASAGFRDSTWLGSTGYPHSEQMRFTERCPRPDLETIP